MSKDVLTRLTAPPPADTAKLPVVPDIPSTGGYIDSKLTKWRANNQAGAIDGLTRLKNSEAGYTGASAQLVESTIKHREALFRYHELPERLGHELAVRRVERVDSLRQAQHRYEVHEIERLQELARVEADLVRDRTRLTEARTVLLDAEQQLKAQREFGALKYQIAHRKAALELLELELTEAQRRALADQALKPADPEPQPLPTSADDEEIYDALIARRQQLDAAGLDTSRIDAVLAARKKQYGT